VSAPVASLTPTGLLARLEAAGAADASVLADRDAAVRDGHYFPSQSTHYATLFDVVRRGRPVRARDVQAWLDLRPDARARWIDGADLQGAAAMLVLEDAALRREELRARDALKRRYAGTPAGDGIGEVLRLADRLSRPAALLPDGYGLPQQDERAALRSQATDLAMRWREASARLHAAAREARPPARRAALEAVEANVGRIGQRLRELNRASGGIELGRAAH
jgi:hypothetical protein